MVSTVYARPSVASRGSMLGRVINRMQLIDDNIVNINMAPSIAEADAILAGFGYSEKQTAIAA